MDRQAEWVTKRPAPPLTPFVERYVGYRMVGFPAGVHRGLPSRHLTFIVSIGSDIDVTRQPDLAQAPDRYRCVVGGLQASPALIAHDGNEEGVAVELTPLGCRALLGMPARPIWNMSVELEDVVGSVAAELWERLQPSEAWADRFDVCDNVLGQLVREESVPAALERSWQLLVRSRGAISVSELAATVGYTRQHFTRRFVDEFGLTPKLAGRVVRFDKARRLVEATPPFVSLAQIAAACGYYDQAHMNRDFVELAGCPPGQLLDDEVLPSFQDDTIDDSRAWGV